MAQITGTMVVHREGRDIPLRLKMSGIARLQAEFGRSIGGVLDGTAGIPDMAVFLRIVQEAIVGADPSRQHDNADRQLADLADDILTEDPGVVERIIKASFPDPAPDAAPGNGKRAAKV